MDCIRKTGIYLGISLLTSLVIMPKAYAQLTCDILTPGISSSPSSIMVGQTSDLVFTVYNDAQGGDCCYAVESVLVYVFLPENGGITFQSIVSPAGGNGSFFDWVFDGASNTVIGTNHTAICDAEGELDVTVRVIGSSLPFYPQNRTVGITILNNPDGPPFTSNNEGNDNGFTTLMINAPLPVELISFDAFPKECHAVDLYWETATEINNKGFEIQKSTDGKLFTSIAFIKGSPTSTGSRYQIQDKQVVSNATYYYRLKQIDWDGQETLFEPLAVKIKNCETLSTRTVYPNPAMDKISVEMHHVDDHQTWTLKINNAMGELVKVIENFNVGQKTDIDISTLTSGIYTLVWENETDILVDKFIKI